MLVIAIVASSGCRLRLLGESQDAGPAASPSRALDGDGGEPASARPADAAMRPPRTVVAFGGIDSPPDRSQQVLAALRDELSERRYRPTDEYGLIIIDGTPPHGAAEVSADSALGAAVAVVVALEDRPEFNAGTGSSLRIDGKTIEMDAALMDSTGRFAAIGAIRSVKNPIRVARALLDTPQRLLVGSGARRFARSVGMGAYNPTSSEARQRYQSTVDSRLGTTGFTDLISPTATPDSSALDPSGDDDDDDDDDSAVGMMNESADAGVSAPRPASTPPPTSRSARDADAADAGTPAPPSTTDGTSGADTVAALVRDRAGHFAGAISSGGPTLSPLGRVSDAVVPGAGLYIGSAGAVAVTGDGDKLFASGMARRVYDAMIRTGSPRQAVEDTLGQAPAGSALGIAAMDRASYFVGSTRPMAWAASDGQRDDYPGHDTSAEKPGAPTAQEPR